MRNKNRTALITIYLFIGFLSGLTAKADGVSNINNFYNQTHTMRANFFQQVTDSQGRKIQEVYGQMVLKRPNKFRWDYNKPFQQQIISDGKQVWLYDVDLAQVTVRDLSKAIGSSPASLLAGESSLEKNFKLVNTYRKDSLDWVSTNPTDNDSGFNKISLGFKAGKLEQMNLVDSFGHQTKITFSNLELNPAIEERTFLFNPPKGVDVVGDK